MYFFEQRMMFRQIEEAGNWCSRFLNLGLYESVRTEGLSIDQFVLTSESRCHRKENENTKSINREKDF